jgi:phosphate/sulfate permease
MSFGALSANAIRALNKGAKLGGFAHDTGEGSISRYHREFGGDLIWELGSGYFGCRNDDGSFCDEKFAVQARSPQVKMIEIKLSRGAKPGHGGVLPGPKVTREIADARGVPVGVDCISLARHSAFSTPVEMMHFIARLRELADGKPVGLKLCIGHPWEFMEIRGTPIATCTGVSFAHGSNDGQKGMGLIMLILIGTVPTAYALNRAMAASQIETFHTVSRAAAEVVRQKAEGYSIIGDPRPAVQQYVSRRKITDGTYPSLAVLIGDISKQVTEYGTLAKVPAAAVGNTRNDMYLVSEALRFLMKDKENDLDSGQVGKLKAYKKSLDDATKFIPLWVKVAVAIALGLGTMVGWKRIVVTVGEKIGKTHRTDAQGASAELVAAATIGAADIFGLPVSTTHVLSSGVAGTMAANGSGLQMATVRNLLMAWVLTLPAAITLSACLFVLFVNLF